MGEPREHWFAGSRTTDFFQAIGDNLAPDYGGDIAKKMCMIATNQHGRGLLGGPAGLFALNYQEAVQLAEDAGGGAGWVKTMEARANMSFVPPTAPQSMGLIPVRSSTPASAIRIHPLPSGRPPREFSITERLEQTGELHTLVIFDRAWCTPTVTVNPETTVIQEHELTRAVGDVCAYFATHWLALNPGVKLCTLMGNGIRDCYPNIPDKCGAARVPGASRDIGKMIYERCRNLQFVHLARVHPMPCIHTCHACL